MRQMEIVYLPLHSPFALKNFTFLAGHEIRNLRETNLGKKKSGHISPNKSIATEIQNEKIL